MSNKECSSCKTSNPASASFCRKCGHRFPEYTKPGKNLMCHIENFSIKKQTNGKFLVEWNAVNADKVTLNGLDVTGKDKFIVTVIGSETIMLRAENETSFDVKESNVVCACQTLYKYKDRIVEKKITSATNVFAIVFLMLFVLLSALLIHYAYQLEDRNYSGDRYLSNIFGHKSYLLVNGSNEGRKVNVPAQGASLIYDVKTNASEYEVFDLPNWCTLEKNDSYFIIKAIKNRLKDRIAEIKVKTPQELVQIQLFQTVYKPGKLLVNNERNIENHIGPTSGELIYQVSTDAADYEIKSIPSWIRITSQDINSFTISYSANASSDKQREGELEIVAEDMVSVIHLKQAAKKIIGKFDNVEVQHSTENGIPGVKIIADFSLYNMLGITGQYAVYFYYKDGSQVIGKNGQFCTADGHVAVSEQIKPRCVASSYTNMDLFVPYDEIMTTKGTCDFFIHCVIWEYSTSNANIVIQSEDYPFTLTQN